jgi:hypothetical protein
MINNFYEFINESIDVDINYYDYEYCDTIYDIDDDNDKYTRYIYMFKNKNNKKYIVNIYFYDYNTSSFTIDFQDYETYKQDVKLNIDIYNRTYKNLNRFDQFKILSTIFKIIKDFYEYNIDILHEFIFSAEDKRKKIYMNIIHKIFPNWKLVKEKLENNMWTLIYHF